MKSRIFDFAFVLSAVIIFTSCGGGGNGGGGINPPPTTYTIGGSVSGLSGSGLVLQNNGGTNLSVAADGTFRFPTAVTSGSSYSVQVFAQPSNPAQMCSVTNGSGTASANITNISVMCSTATTTTYTIGGTVSGLSGGGLVLQNNSGDNLSVSASGGFTFATPIAAGSTYSVTVLTQPSNPSQNCTVSGGSGTANAIVTTVSITCTTTVSTYTIGGTLSGLSSGTLVLQDNGGDNLSLKANGSFTFAAQIASGGNYAVTVSAQPASQFCSVTNGSGVATAKVTNVQVSCVATTGKTIPLTFFGSSFNFFTIWPPTDGDGQVATLGSLRLWDDKVKWGQINTADGKYDWTLLDSYMTMAQSMSLNVLYTFGDTPDFAGTIPTKSGVHCLAPSDYSCSPPNDVNTDGTGADKFFSNFVTALVTRYKGRISYYDLWNEPDCPCYFAGTQAQMVRMNQDASSIIRSIDPKALILSPSGHVWTMATWFDPYIAAGGAPTFDIVNMHMRGNGDALNIVPESFLTTYANIVSDVQAQGLGNRPLWDSEHGIKADENVTDPDTLAGYLARELALRAGVGLVRQYLYSWDDNAPVGVQGTIAGTAWDTEAGWLLGHTISPCSANGTIYTCNLDDGQIVWDTAQTCNAGVCTSSNYTFPSSYAFQTDLAGKKTALSGKTVPIAYKPIFLTAN
ncbi:MAG: cellulase family glycosylhydrolase [Candidatus Sulfotelmatobacter sp.]